MAFFEFYITESPVDGGIVIASKHDLDEDLKKILSDLQGEGLTLGGKPN